jgi:SAM-dependent methyltransferase
MTDTATDISSEGAEVPSFGLRQEPQNSRSIEYLSPAAKVSMADQWFEIASINHFWVQRRFSVLQKLAGQWLPSTKERAEIGCGHGLLQRQIEDAYGLSVTGFDLNDFALKQNISRISRVCCYDIFQRDAALRSKFDLVFLFDVLEHISDQDGFLQALLFHLAPQGRVVVNVPAGQWAFSGYDRAAGHVRRYSFAILGEVAERNKLRPQEWSYWGLPLVPILALRKAWLSGRSDQQDIIRTGFDSRSESVNAALGIISRAEIVPQHLLGSSLMAVFQALD